MPQKYKFWKDLLSQLKFANWDELRTCLIADAAFAIVLGVIIGGLFGWQIEKVGLFWGCVAGVLLFGLIGLSERIWYFLQFLYCYVFNK